MNANCPTAPRSEFASQRSARPANRTGRGTAWRIELVGFAILIVCLNWSLLIAGRCGTGFIFLPEAVRAGEWWRVLTHPFVHVSMYHLCLDATACFILYGEFKGKRWWERSALLLATIGGSLLASLWAAPMIQSRGLCGLSGVAHGLAAVSALEMMTGAQLSGDHRRTLFHLGWISLVLVAGKSAFEAMTGQVAFASWHLGSLGTPIAVCHAGGVVGGMGFWLAARIFSRWRASNRAHTIS